MRDANRNANDAFSLLICVVGAFLVLVGWLIFKAVFGR